MFNARFLNLEYLFRTIIDFISALTLAGLIKWLMDIMNWLKPYSTIICLLLMAGIFYCATKMRQINLETKEKLYPPDGQVAQKVKLEQVNPRWEKVLNYMKTDNPDDWKLAILEADIMLDEMIKSMNYPGDTLADRMKAIEPSDFATLDQAWEAHKIRNNIAHEGSSYVLTSREARRAIHLYRQVFEEFRYI